MEQVALRKKKVIKKLIETAFWIHPIMKTMITKLKLTRL